jgi:hypothetical protein
MAKLSGTEYQVFSEERYAWPLFRWLGRRKDQLCFLTYAGVEECQSHLIIRGQCEHREREVFVSSD